MKTAFVLISFAFGMTLAVMAYLVGGVVLMATGLAFSVVIFGCIIVMVSRLHQVLLPKDDAQSEFAITA